MTVVLAKDLGPSTSSPPNVKCVERVVIVSDDVVESGGAAVVAITSAKLLRRRGIPVTMLSGEADIDPALSANDIGVVSLGGEHILGGPRWRAAFRGLYDSGIRSRIEAFLRNSDTPNTIYHLHNWHKVLSPSALAALRPVEDRLVLTTHDFFLACPNGAFFDYRRERPCEVRPLSGSCLSTRCDKRHSMHKAWRVARDIVKNRALGLRGTRATILAVHDGMLPLLRRAGIPAGSLAVLRNPVTPWRSERIQAERNEGALYVGRLDKDKGVDVLLAAARVAGVGVQVVGDGPLISELEARFPETVFHGRLDRKRIAGLAETARLVAVPTRARETFGLVALEGLLSGLPVVISTTALIAPELVRHGMAFDCPPGDVAALASRLSTLAGDSALVARMSHAGFTHGRCLAPTPEDWAASLFDVYERKLAQARA